MSYLQTMTGQQPTGGAGLMRSSAPTTPSMSDTILGSGAPTNGSAKDMQAWLTREQWEDMKKTFKPVIDEMIEVATDDKLGEKMADQAVAGVGSSFDAANQQASMQRERYGIQQTGEQSANDARVQGRQKALAQASAANTAQETAKKIRTDILFGG